MYLILRIRRLNYGTTQFKLDKHPSVIFYMHYMKLTRFLRASESSINRQCHSTREELDTHSDTPHVARYMMSDYITSIQV